MSANAHDYRHRSGHKIGLSFVALLSASTIVLGQDLRISGIQVDAQGRVVLEHASNTNFYYILYSGDLVTNIALPADLALGLPGQGRFTNSANLSPLKPRFYRIRQVPISQPFDTDGDSIDDAWELRFRRTGAALNSADANEDHNGNGIPDINDYPGPIKIPIVAAFDAVQSAVLTGESVAVLVRFSRPFKGTLLYDASGTAMAGFDYAPLTGKVSVDGADFASILVSALESGRVGAARTLVLSLKEPGSSEYLVRTASTSRINIQEGDVGTFSGNLEFPDALALAPIRVDFAVRSRNNGRGEAILRMGDSLLLTNKFSLPVGLSPGSQFAFDPSAIGEGTLQTDGFIGRKTRWKLRATGTEFADGRTGSTNQLPVATFVLRLENLASTSQPVELIGRLPFAKLD